jgi:hypothetical protein
MKRIGTIFAAVVVLSLGAAVAHAERVYLSAVHGIPGLEEPVDVYVNDAYLFSFDFTDTFGPAPLEAGTYKVEIYYQGAPVPGLSASVDLDGGASYTVVAHLDAEGAIAPLALYSKEISPVRDSYSRLQIHHLAAAPTVDVSFVRGASRLPNFELAGLANGDQATAIDVRNGGFNISLLANDAEVFSTGEIRLRSGDNIAVYAVGVFPSSFSLVYLALD